MKTLFVLASAMTVLFLAAPDTIIPVEANNTESQTSVSRPLEVRVAQLEKRLAAVEAQLARIAATPLGPAQSQQRQLSGPSRDSGTPFIGNWNAGGPYGTSVSISKDGSKYIVRSETSGGKAVQVCELNNGSLKCGESVIGFIESSGHITFHGVELERVP